MGCQEVVVLLNPVGLYMHSLEIVVGGSAIGLQHVLKLCLGVSKGMSSITCSNKAPLLRMLNLMKLEELPQSCG